jgi:hypothetical protein
MPQCSQYHVTPPALTVKSGRRKSRPPVAARDGVDQTFRAVPGFGARDRPEQPRIARGGFRSRLPAETQQGRDVALDEKREGLLAAGQTRVGQLAPEDVGGHLGEH